jgi:hypothetical protein
MEAIRTSLVALQAGTQWKTEVDAVIDRLAVKLALMMCVLTGLHAEAMRPTSGEVAG